MIVGELRGIIDFRNGRNLMDSLGEYLDRGDRLLWMTENGQSYVIYNESKVY